jgi:mRNA-degrading endonuclease YafQ of YafQ-DinJ toxin-antitoxin module
VERPIELHRSFVRNYQKRIARNARLAAQYKARVKLFANGVRGAPLYDHALTESREGQRAFSVTGDVRVIYIETPTAVVFLDIGSHNQVYGK